MGEAPAAATVAPAGGLLAVLNLIPLALLATALSPVLTRLYSRRSRLAAGWAVGLVGVVIPVGLLAVSGGVVTAAAVLVAIVLTNLGIRFVIIHLPHHATEA